MARGFRHVMPWNFAGLVLLRQPQHTAALRKLVPKQLDAIVVGEASHAMTDSVLDLSDAVSGLVEDWHTELQRQVLAEFIERRLPCERLCRMIQYFINRAGKNLPAGRKRQLEKAKKLLQTRETKQG